MMDFYIYWVGFKKTQNKKIISHNKYYYKYGKIIVFRFIFVEMIWFSKNDLV